MLFYTVAESLEDALRQLYLIDAIDEDGSVTRVGRTMSGKSLQFELLNMVLSTSFLLLPTCRQRGRGMCSMFQIYGSRIPTKVHLDWRKCLFREIHSA